MSSSGLVTDIPNWSLAQFPSGAETLLRLCYGALLAAQLLQTAFVSHRFFASERYGGYTFSTRWTDRFLRPNTVRAVVALWVLCAVAIALNWALILACAVNLVLSRLFFVELRWRGILRGMGAPGQIAYWLAALMFLLAFSHQWDVNGLLRAFTVIAFRLDFAAIFFVAGIYKITAGYLQHQGAEVGLVNPLWGWWHRALSKLPPDHLAFRTFNYAAVVAEIVCPIAFLIPLTSAVAAAAFATGFLTVGALLRLTFLAEMVAAACILYVTPHDTFGLQLLMRAPSANASGLMALVVIALATLAGIYIVALPFSYAGMAYNFYARRRLSEWLQRVLDIWVRLCSLSLWRVFTADITNFAIEIEARNSQSGVTRPIMPRPRASIASLMRQLHVGESITLVSLFTTRRYYPSNLALFEKRLVTYARALELLPDELVLFHFIDIKRAADRWTFQVSADYIVDPAAAKVIESNIEGYFDATAPASGSPIHGRGAPSGSYAPLRQTDR